MTIVSTRDFRANQTKYLGMAQQGHDVILRSRRGSFRLTPIEEEEKEEPKRDVTAEVCQAMKDWKEYLETGKSDKFRPAKELLYELRNLEAQIQLNGYSQCLQNLGSSSSDFDLESSVF